MANPIQTICKRRAWTRAVPFLRRVPFRRPVAGLFTPCVCISSMLTSMLLA